ncbi:MAG: glycosyltransferase [Candidatus Symbiothrix sp.]|jgi:glycosyltransferase involved in cell wall biosynthesis|nr:glycosyltransferase [Candidatus Symbiothrix sp.]
MKGILFVTTYPPRECGIATFSGDLIQAIQTKFGSSFSINVCALESQTEKFVYPDTVKYTLNTSDASDYQRIAGEINADDEISLVLIEHEFGLFAEHENEFLQFVKTIAQPVIIVFHTVLPHPESSLKSYLRKLTSACSAVIVMTQISARILQQEYGIAEDKITVIPHGTHLVLHSDKKTLKEKYKVSGRRVLTTFGLLSPGKSIETTLDALPAIVKENPSVIFLIIGKTHPTILKNTGEKYREMLEAKVAELGLTDSVRFVNLYLDLPILLEYLQLTDIYLFTSSDPNQAVSGTFVYALSCGCPIIATPIPHALELLKDNSGIIFDFKDSVQLAHAANRLLSNENLRSKMRITGLQKTASTAWENSAIAHALLFQEKSGRMEPLIYSLPPVKAEHIKRMSHNFAMIQFSRGNRPDIKTGYTLDDNARALMALCKVYVEKKDISCEKYIKSYLNFIHYCLQPDGSFLNYVQKDMLFTAQNQEVGLEDSNGRAIYALGYFISYAGKFPDVWTLEAIQVLKQTFPMITQMQSPRSIAFALHGLCYYFRQFPAPDISALISLLADKLVDYYRQNKEEDWLWFEACLTYDNSVLPESLLYAYLATGDTRYKEIAKESFDFLLEKIFTEDRIKVISNQGWLQKEKKDRKFGEQPVDVAGTVIALKTFYTVFKEEEYLRKQKIAFDWFLGNNHLHQIIYNPATGGCYDGLEENNINLNQGAESTVCYLMARLSV